MFRPGTFNLESLDDGPGIDPPLAQRLGVLRPQLERLRADVVCLQVVNAQRVAGAPGRVLAALDRLIEGSPLAGFHRAVTMRSSGREPADAHNLVILSRFPIVASRQYLQDLVDPPCYRPATADPPTAEAAPVRWDRPFLVAIIELPGGRRLHVVDLHLKAPLAASVPGQKLEPFVWRTIGDWSEGMFLAAIKGAGQALEVRLAIDRLFDADDGALVAVCGDVNAGEGEIPPPAARTPASPSGAVGPEDQRAARHGLAQDDRAGRAGAG